MRKNSIMDIDVFGLIQYQNKILIVQDAFLCR